jgi:hypothetical protein
MIVYSRDAGSKAADWTLSEMLIGPFKGKKPDAQSTGKITRQIVFLWVSLAIAGETHQQIGRWRDARRSPETSSTESSLREPD